MRRNRTVATCRCNFEVTTPSIVIAFCHITLLHLLPSWALVIPEWIEERGVTLCYLLNVWMPTKTYTETCPAFRLPPNFFSIVTRRVGPWILRHSWARFLAPFLDFFGKPKWIDPSDSTSVGGRLFVFFSWEGWIQLPFIYLRSPWKEDSMVRVDPFQFFGKAHPVRVSPKSAWSGWSRWKNLEPSSGHMVSFHLQLPSQSSLVW